jgi:AraC-like DNA-binding protein
MSISRHRDPALVRTLACSYPGGFTLEPHRHEWSQLIYASSGVMTVRAAGASWVVPPERGVWVPAGVTHSIEMSGQVKMRSLYFAPGFARRRLPRVCNVVHVTPLMRELILHACAVGPLLRESPAHVRLSRVLADQIETLPEMPLELAMPRDPRACRVAEWLRGHPHSYLSLERVAAQAGASKRTIERCFREEAGMALGRWRQQSRLLHALRLLAAGEPVTSVALDSGYQSTSAFIAMFKKALGTTPLRYRTKPTPR